MKFDMSLNKNHNPGFDLLRILAIFGVIVMHVTSGILVVDCVGGFDYYTNLVYNAPFHYGVPIFVMISGALFLNPEKEISIKRLWLHNILRLLVVYLLWSSVYGLWDYMQYDAKWTYLAWEIVTSKDHLWFLPMIIGIYMITPLLHSWVKNASRKQVEYILLLFVVLQIVCETLKALPFPELLSFVIDTINVQLVCSYVGYFILGYYLFHLGIKKKYLKYLYIAGIVAALASVASVVILAKSTGKTNVSIVDSYSLFTFVFAIAIFVFVNRIFDKNSCIRVEERTEGDKETKAWVKIMLSELSIASFGAYLCHVAVIEILMTCGFCVDSFPLIFGIPLYSVSVFLISSIISYIMRKIPFVGRWVC